MSLKNLVQATYDAVAQTQHCVCENDCADQEASTSIYSGKELSIAPSEANLGLSCGNPITLAGLKEGESVLDLGAGAGFDSFLAAAKVKAAGYVIGVDFSKAMVQKAMSIAAARKISNVRFIHADIEQLPVSDATIDIAISNCVLNLVADKEKVYREVYRVLKKGGRISVSDIALLQPLPAGLDELIGQQSSCLVSPLTIESYKKMLSDICFSSIEIKASPVAGCFTEDSADPFGVSLGRAMRLKGIEVDQYLASIQIDAFKY